MRLINGKNIPLSMPLPIRYLQRISFTTIIKMQWQTYQHWNGRGKSRLVHLNRDSRTIKVFTERIKKQLASVFNDQMKQQSFHIRK